MQLYQRNQQHEKAMKEQRQMGSYNISLDEEENMNLSEEDRKLLLQNGNIMFEKKLVQDLIVVFDKIKEKEQQQKEEARLQEEKRRRNQLKSIKSETKLETNQDTEITITQYNHRTDRDIDLIARALGDMKHFSEYRKDQEFQKLLVQAAKVVQLKIFHKGDFIFHYGEMNHEVYFILEGQCSLYVPANQFSQTECFQLKNSINQAQHEIKYSLKMSDTHQQGLIRQLNKAEQDLQIEIQNANTREHEQQAGVPAYLCENLKSHFKLVNQIANKSVFGQFSILFRRPRAATITSHSGRVVLFCLEGHEYVTIFDQFLQKLNLVPLALEQMFPMCRKSMISNLASCFFIKIELGLREPLYLEGQPADCIYVLQKGNLELRKNYNIGSEKDKQEALIIQVLEEGDIFGIEAMVPNFPPRLSSAISTDYETIIYSCSRKIWHKLLHNSIDMVEVRAIADKIMWGYEEQGQTQIHREHEGQAYSLAYSMNESSILGGLRSGVINVQNSFSKDQVKVEPTTMYQKRPTDDHSQLKVLEYNLQQYSQCLHDRIQLSTFLDRPENKSFLSNAKEKSKKHDFQMYHSPVAVGKIGRVRLKRQSMNLENSITSVKSADQFKLKEILSLGPQILINNENDKDQNSIIQKHQLQLPVILDVQEQYGSGNGGHGMPYNFGHSGSERFNSLSSNRFTLASNEDNPDTIRRYQPKRFIFNSQTPTHASAAGVTGSNFDKTVSNQLLPKIDIRMVQKQNPASPLQKCFSSINSIKYNSQNEELNILNQYISNGQNKINNNNISDKKIKIVTSPQASISPSQKRELTQEGQITKQQQNNQKMIEKKILQILQQEEQQTQLIN